MGTNCKIFAKTIEQSALDQISLLANSEAYGSEKIRIMPDCHSGKGCVIGTTMTISDKVTPSLVGVDIGCSILTVFISDDSVDLERLDQVIRENIPLGFNVYDYGFMFRKLLDLKCYTHIGLDYINRSVGTLGGGNHFIELAKVSDNSVAPGAKYALLIHTGSRKLGVEVCNHYQGIADMREYRRSDAIKQLVQECKLSGRKKELESAIKEFKANYKEDSFKYLSGRVMNDYLHDIAIVQEWSNLNREVIANRIIELMGFSEVYRFNTMHNYVDLDRKILRKGAVSAELGKILVIPMNMRDGSLLCIGKGNPDWNYSAPHGAGRLMSRSKAKNSLSMSEYSKEMEKAGVYTTSVNESTLDEAPMAYKPIDEIIELIQDAVEIVGIMKPIYNIKAGE